MYLVTIVKRLLPKLFGGNVTPEVLCLYPSVKSRIPVTYQINSSWHDSLVQQYNAEMFSPDQNGVGLYEREIADNVVKAAFQQGRRDGSSDAVLRKLKIDVGEANVFGLVLGSGNYADDTEIFIKNTVFKDMMTLTTTSGGWVQNLTKYFGNYLNDQGVVNTAYLRGFVEGLSGKGYDTMYAVFSQGGAANRIVENNLPDEFFDSKHQTKVVTLGASQKSRGDNIALVGAGFLFGKDIVPTVFSKAYEWVDTYRTKGREYVIYTNGTHGAMNYIEALSKNYLQAMSLFRRGLKDK